MSHFGCFVVQAYAAQLLTGYEVLSGEELHKHFASVPILFALYYFKYFIYFTDKYEINMFKPIAIKEWLNVSIAFRHQFWLARFSLIR